MSKKPVTKAKTDIVFCVALIVLHIPNNDPARTSLVQCIVTATNEYEAIGAAVLDTLKKYGEPKTTTSILNVLATDTAINPKEPS